MTAVRELNDIHQIEPIRVVWHQLLATTPGADFFRTPEWLQVYWRHFGTGQRLRLLVVEHDGRCMGIVPFVVRRQWTKAGPFRQLTWPMDNWGSFYGPVGPQVDATLAAGLRHVLAGRHDWDLIELQWLDTAAGRDAWVQRSLGQCGLACRLRPQQLIPIASLRSGWDHYWATRKGIWRQNCRRNERKLRAFSRVELVRYRPRGSEAGEDDPRWDLYDQCEQVARRSWQGSSTTGTTLSHESIRPFLRDMHKTAVRAGAVDLNLLQVDGEPAAFSYNYFYRGRVSGLRLGFDPRFSRYGVGTVLTYRMIRDSCERGDHTFDFLPGSVWIKRHWQTVVRTSYRCTYYPPWSLRGQALRLKRWLSDAVAARRTSADVPSRDKPQWDVAKMAAWQAKEAEPRAGRNVTQCRLY